MYKPKIFRRPHFWLATSFCCLHQMKFLKHCGKWNQYIFIFVQFLLLPRCFHFSCLIQIDDPFFRPFPNGQILHSSKLDEFTDDNFEFNENGREFSIGVENTVGKRRNCSIRAISPFPTVFFKEFFCRHVKTRACLEKG